MRKSVVTVNIKTIMMKVIYVIIVLGYHVAAIVILRIIGIQKMVNYGNAKNNR
jgi:hypothetical protein